MCTTCFTATEAAVINGAALLAMGKGAVERVGDKVAGRPPAARRQAAWDANARFLVDLGLQPGDSLGPRPVVPAVPVPALAEPALDVAGRWADGHGLRLA